MVEKDENQELEFKVILFYRYVLLPEELQDNIVKKIKEKCEYLNILGRVLIASEGVNGTLSGSVIAIDTFCEYFTGLDSRFSRIDWKDSFGRDKHLPFLGLSIRKVKEIVSTGQSSEFISKNVLFDEESFGGLVGTGQHITPEEFHHAVEKKDGIVLDIRNEFEYDIGHFEGAVGLKTFTYSETFTALDQVLDKEKQEQDVVVEDKPIYMYCTGGIRCEKASAYLCAKGYKNVFQLQGGIHRYLQSFPEGGVFQGKNFVFDSRVAVPAVSTSECEDNTVETAVGKCLDCEKSFDRYSGANVCTVCRIPVLICDECVSANNAPGEFHCSRHRDLKSLYYTVLSRFSKEELLSQREGLQQMLITNLQRSVEIKKQNKERNSLVSLDCSKNRRRTLRKQIERIDSLVIEMDNNNNNNRLERVDDNILVNPKARSNWGFWR